MDVKDAIPTFVGSYELGNLVHQGSLGTCYEGVCRSSPRVKVVIKITETTNPRYEALRGVLETLSKLPPHPHIVSTLQVQEEAAGIEIVEERAEGMGVLDYIVHAPFFCERDAGAVSKQLLQALAHLHAQGIAHRGVKPDTVRVTALPPSSSSPPSLHILLLDSLLASVKHSSRLNTPATYSSDPEFIPPENFGPPPETGGGNSPVLVNADQAELHIGKEDTWAVGMLLLAMLCGTVPRFQDDPRTLTTAALTMAAEKIEGGAGTAVAPSTLEGLSVSAVAAVTAMLKIDPALRASAACCLNLEFVADLGGGSNTPLNHQQTLAAYIRRRKTRKAGVKLVRLQERMALLSEQNQQEREAVARVREQYGQGVDVFKFLQRAQSVQAGLGSEGGHSGGGAGSLSLDEGFELGTQVIELVASGRDRACAKSLARPGGAPKVQVLKGASDFAGPPARDLTSLSLASRGPGPGPFQVMSGMEVKGRVLLSQVVELQSDSQLSSQQSSLSGSPIPNPFSNQDSPIPNPDPSPGAFQDKGWPSPGVDVCALNEPEPGSSLSHVTPQQLEAAGAGSRFQVDDYEGLVSPGRLPVFRRIGTP